MSTNIDAITQAEQNFVELFGGKVVAWRGHLAEKLFNSPDFAVAVKSPSCFQVWEVTDSTHDWRTDASQHVCIHRANQSVLSTDNPAPATGALDYMGEANRVLVHNRDVKEGAPVDRVLFEMRRRIYDERGHP
jgi:hypothetical protein